MSISEEFKDQKINQILEDYIALDKEIKDIFSNLKQALEETPSRFDAVISAKLDQLIRDSVEIDSEIKEASEKIAHEAEKAKKYLNLTASETKEKLTADILDLIASLKSNQEKVIENYQKQIDEQHKLYKSAVSKVTPFSTSKAIAICTACTLFVSAGLSGAFWYVAQQQKEASLSFYANGYTDIQKLMEKSIKIAPASKQQELKNELEAINNRKQ
ncbi:TPA: hypothetical protein G8549_004534 [Salmonella enterica]|uniref:Uncharacterized protein n=1 Tax=Salmonella enterica TaxID=28901 RepID=A0A763YNJ8_SALER|nr:hypothetical protein [Salmonella enterica]